VSAALASGLAGLAGPRRAVVAFLLGLCAVAALPPVHAIPLLIPAFAGLVLMLDGARRVWRAFWLGWWFGLGYFVGGLYWLAWPLTLDLARFGWLIPFAVFGISGGLAILPGLVAAIVHRARWRGPSRVLLLAAAWLAAEWARGNLLTGFPWNLIATAWMPVPAALQPAAWIGGYGLGFATVLVAAAPALLVERALRRRDRALGLGVPAALFAILVAAGAIRLGQAPAGEIAGVRLRIVQGNVEQSLKWVPERRERTFALYLDLTRQAGFERITHAIWPETAIDYRFETDYPAVRIEGERQARLAQAVPRGGALLLGAIRDADRRWHNSFHVIGADGRALATYDKHHLVPFGEYVPARPLLRRLGIEQLAHGAGDYAAGPGPGSLPVPGAPNVAPVICYEAIFPGAVTPARDRPGWIVNVTNDAWFGTTSGPYQHLAAARLRAVEEGLPVVRAANTGISAVIDSHGRIVAELGLNRRGTLDSALPLPVAMTVYNEFGDIIPLLLCTISLMFAALFRRCGRNV
jgi:apolipoprotein N-acyltransferase